MLNLYACCMYMLFEYYLSVYFSGSKLTALLLLITICSLCPKRKIKKQHVKCTNNLEKVWK